MLHVHCDVSCTKITAVAMQKLAIYNKAYIVCNCVCVVIYYGIHYDCIVMFSLTGQWTTPCNIGEFIPPIRHFVIENITKTRAILFGGEMGTNDENNFDSINEVYLVDIKENSLVDCCTTDKM